MELENLVFTTDLDLSLRDVTALREMSDVYVLVDSNTQTLCLPLLRQTLRLPDSQVVVIAAGDEHKTLATVEQVWQTLFERGATRRSLLINLGGGMVCDLGGFVASTYMRGIDFVNIPTTLLAQVDASFGGKTGFNYMGLKNSIGVFAKPKKVIICPDFFPSLPVKQLLSGYAEVLKHALISSPLELNRVLAYDIERQDMTELMAIVKRSLVIKNYIVEQDPTETGMRKTLNLGHTIGHALEEMSLKQWREGKGEMLPHGYAVFYGLIAELYLSVKKLGLDKKVLEQCLPLFYHYYGKPVCSCREQDELIELMRHDKKNLSTSEINFTLLRQVGNAYINRTCTEEEIKEALDYLFSL